MRLRALLENDALGLRLLGGEDELDRTVRGVMTTDLKDPSRYLSGGELVLTGLAWLRGRRTPSPSPASSPRPGSRPSPPVRRSSATSPTISYRRVRAIVCRFSR